MFHQKNRYNSQAICLLAKFQDLPIHKQAYNRLKQPSKITVGSAAQICPSASHSGHPKPLLRSSAERFLSIPCAQSAPNVYGWMPLSKTHLLQFTAPRSDLRSSRNRNFHAGPLPLAGTQDDPTRPELRTTPCPDRPAVRSAVCGALMPLWCDSADSLSCAALRPTRC